MGLSDKFKDLRAKAEDAVVERKDQIHDVVQKVETTADEKTGGKYRERIQKAGAATVGFVDGVKGGAGAAEGGVDDEVPQAPVDERKDAGPETPAEQPPRA